MKNCASTYTWTWAPAGDYGQHGAVFLPAFAKAKLVHIVQHLNSSPTPWTMNRAWRHKGRPPTMVH